MPPTRVLADRYELISQLGEGGFGSVWRARDTRMGREVAVKLLHVTTADIARFQREATALARLNHPNIVIAHDFGIDADNTAYLVLEHVVGRSLADELAAARAAGLPGLALPDVLDVADQVLAGLANAHAAQVVHRDLKPANLMRTPNGDIKILDFGIAHVAEAAKMTSTGSFLGTLPYMAPEQFEGTGIDGRTDLYALGCVLHELLTGASPFQATSNASWMHAHYTQIPAHAADRVVGIPAPVDAFIDMLLAKSSADRPADAGVARRLLAALPTQIAGAAGPGPAAPGASAVPVTMPGAAAQGAAATVPPGTPRPPTVGDLAATVGRQPAAAAPASVRQPPWEGSAGPSRERPIRARRLRLWISIAAVLLTSAGTTAGILLTTSTASPGSSGSATSSDAAGPDSQSALAASSIPASPSASPDPSISAAPSGSPSASARPSARPSGSAHSAASRTGLTASHDATITDSAGPVWSVAFSPDGRTLATASYDKTAKLWNIANPSKPSLEAALAGHTSYVTLVAFSPDGHTVVSASNEDDTATLWNITNPSKPVLEATLGDGDTGYVTMAAFSPDGHTLATAAYDDTAKLWNITNPSKPVLDATFGGNNSTFGSMAFSPNGHILAAGTADGTELWATTSPTQPVLDATITGSPTSVAFSPDGHTLATGDDDGTAGLWNVTNPNKPVREAAVSGDDQPVLAVAFSPEGHTLATGGDDAAVKVWDVTSADKPVLDATLTGVGAFMSLAFSPGGDILATANGDGTVKLWHVT